MDGDVKLNHLQSELDSLEYPIERSSVREAASDVTLVYANGEELLVDVLDRIADDRFDSADDFATEIYNALPVEAVGEPGQSEGEG